MYSLTMPGNVAGPLQEGKCKAFNIKENDIANIATDEETKGFIEFEKGFVKVTPAAAAVAAFSRLREPRKRRRLLPMMCMET